MVNPKHRLNEEYIYPASVNLLERLYEKALKPISQGNDVALYSLKMVGKRGLFAMLVYGEEGEIFRKRYDDTLFVFIEKPYGNDPSVLWHDFATQLGVDDYGPSTDVLIKRILEKVRDLTRVHDKRVVIILNQPSKWFGDNRAAQVALIDFKKVFKEKVSFLLLLDIGEELDSEPLGKFVERGNFEAVYWPIFPKEEMLHQINRSLFINGRPIRVFNKQEEALIYKMSGGVSVIANYLGALSANSLTEEQILNDAKYNSFLGALLGSLPTSLRQSIAKETFDKKLFECGLMDKDGKVISEIFREYCNSSISNENQRLIEKFVNKEFTKQESAVFELLKAHQSEIVSREEVAKVMWGDDYSHRYSDWSIDSVISRIRKKVGERYNLITHKGRGFSLNPQ